jgi:hypothetical protein
VDKLGYAAEERRSVFRLKFVFVGLQNNEIFIKMSGFGLVENYSILLGWLHDQNSVQSVMLAAIQHPLQRRTFHTPAILTAAAALFLDVHT